MQHIDNQEKPELKKNKQQFVNTYLATRDFNMAVAAGYWVKGPKAKDIARNMITDTVVLERIFDMSVWPQKNDKVRVKAKELYNAFYAEEQEAVIVDVQPKSIPVQDNSPQQPQNNQEETNNTQNPAQDTTQYSLQELQSMCEKAWIKYSHLAKEKSLILKLQDAWVL